MENSPSSVQKKILLTSEKRPSLHPLATVVHDAKNKMMPILFALDERKREFRSDQFGCLNIYVQGVRQKIDRFLENIKRGVDDQLSFNASLNHLRGQLKNLLDYITSGEDTQYSVSYDKLKESIDEFEALIERALALTQAQPYEDRLEPGNISDHINNVIHDYQRRYSQVHFKTHIHSDCEVLFHPLRLKRALENLLNNAVQALPEKDGKISVSLTNQFYDRRNSPFFEIQEGCYVSIEIDDNGSGIPEDVLEKLEHSVITTKKEGSGFGLVSARKSIIRHGGHLYIENKREGGAKVTVLLPRYFASSKRILNTPAQIKAR